MKLYSYYRSSAAYRVRIVMNLKQIDYQQQAVNLLTEQELKDDYKKVNPQNMVPVLEHDGHVFFQSMAILEYLEEIYPEPPIFPETAAARAMVRALANIIACDIHPLNNLRVLKYLSSEFDLPTNSQMGWYRHWIEQGFQAFEAHLEKCSDGLFCFGGKPGMADALLIPQVFNARRFDVEMSAFPVICNIEKHCLKLPAFATAHPGNQPDAI